MHTRSQSLAKAAFPKVEDRFNSMKSDFKEYASIAKKFPALVHTCGLAQAVAFYQAKGASKDGKQQKPHLKYLEDLVEVVATSINFTGKKVDDFTKKVLEEQLSAYIRLTRITLQAATWLKRYVEAVEPDDKVAGVSA